MKIQLIATHKDKQLDIVIDNLSVTEIPSLLQTIHRKLDEFISNN